MKITIISIGKFSKNDPNLTLFLKYQKRLPWKMQIKELETKGNLQGEVLKNKEAELLLAAVPGGAKIIALDEKGKNLSSPEFAKSLESFGSSGNSNLAFVIGGADGLSEILKKRADLILSFGKMTFPHMMIRAFLAEQIYRAHTIISNHPYHRI
ncbi:MAG: 23S rRNA (pseudouridine1915-N3)-methyltransferase [Rickettsiales bacterium]|jgi:23S rRNA (pseudouridine1915-N3)-methyltransferase